MTTLTEAFQIEIMPIHVMVQENRFCLLFTNQQTFFLVEGPIREHRPNRSFQSRKDLRPALDFILSRIHVVHDVLQRFLHFRRRRERRARPQKRAVFREIDEARKWNMRPVVEPQKVRQGYTLRMRTRQGKEIAGL